MNNTRIAANIATTPPSLLGIERRIAYAQRKYHSGIMCKGVTKGFAGMKFSGSPRIVGKKRTIVPRDRKKNINPAKSLVE